MLEAVHEVALASFDPDTTIATGGRGPAYWYDSLGLVYHDSGIWAARLDGKSLRFSILVTYVAAFDQDLHLPIVQPHANPADWRPIVLPVTESARASQSDALSGGCVVYGAGAGFYRPNGAQVERVTLPGRVVTGMVTLPHTTGTYAYLHPAEAPPCRRWWVLDSDSGWCQRWNESEGTVDLVRRVGSGWRRLGYSLKHDLFIGIYGSGPYTLRAYAPDPVAASVGVPAFDPSPRRGAMSDLSAVVLGADGEPCGGRNVEFAVTAGSVVPTVAQTDDTGTATVRYRAPDTAVSGQTATATLVE